MQTKQIELYVEKIRSGIEITGTIDNEYVELRYKYFLSHPSDLEGHYNIVRGDAHSIARTYGEIFGRNIETDDYGNWKSSTRKKINDDMFIIIGEVENYLSNIGYIIIE